MKKGLYKRTDFTGFLFTLSLLCIFALCAFLVVMTGANVYQGTVRNLEDTWSTGTALSYVTEKIRQHDTDGSIILTELDGETALLLLDEINGEIYETYIYPHDDSLYELVIRAGTEISASMGEEILPVKNFSITEKPGGFLELSAGDSSGNAVRCLMHLQNGSGYQTLYDTNQE